MIGRQQQPHPPGYEARRPTGQLALASVDRRGRRPNAAAGAGRLKGELEGREACGGRRVEGWLGEKGREGEWGGGPRRARQGREGEQGGRQPGDGSRGVKSLRLPPCLMDNATPGGRRRERVLPFGAAAVFLEVGPSAPRRHRRARRPTGCGKAGRSAGRRTESIGDVRRPRTICRPMRRLVAVLKASLATLVCRRLRAIASCRH